MPESTTSPCLSQNQLQPVASSIIDLAAIAAQRPLNCQAFMQQLLLFNTRAEVANIRIIDQAAITSARTRLREQILALPPHQSVALLLLLNSIEPAWREISCIVVTDYDQLFDNTKTTIAQLTTGSTLLRDLFAIDLATEAQVTQTYALTNPTGVSDAAALKDFRKRFNAEHSDSVIAGMRAAVVKLEQAITLPDPKRAQLQRLSTSRDLESASMPVYERLMQLECAAEQLKESASASDSVSIEQFITDIQAIHHTAMTYGKQLQDKACQDETSETQAVLRLRTALVDRFTTDDYLLAELAELAELAGADRAVAIAIHKHLLAAQAIVPVVPALQAILSEVEQVLIDYNQTLGEGQALDYAVLQSLVQKLTPYNTTSSIASLILAINYPVLQSTEITQDLNSGYERIFGEYKHFCQIRGLNSQHQSKVVRDLLATATNQLSDISKALEKLTVAYCKKMIGVSGYDDVTFDRDYDTAISEMRRLNHLLANTRQQLDQQLSWWQRLFAWLRDSMQYLRGWRYRAATLTEVLASLPSATMADGSQGYPDRQPLPAVMTASGEMSAAPFGDQNGYGPSKPEERRPLLDKPGGPSNGG